MPSVDTVTLSRLYHPWSVCVVRGVVTPGEPHECEALTVRTKRYMYRSHLCLRVSAATSAPGLSEKQRRILEYLREHADERTYFKSRLIAEDLGLSAKEVGTNMTAITDGEFDIEVEKWGYSSGTTWMVTR